MSQRVSMVPQRSSPHPSPQARIPTPPLTADGHHCTSPSPAKTIRPPWSPHSSPRVPIPTQPTPRAGHRSTSPPSSPTRPPWSPHYSPRVPIPNAADAEGWTPLHFAVTREDDSSAVVAALFAAGADPNAADAEGWTPLHGAAELADSPAVVAALLAAGADPNAADAEGWTPLHIATQENSAAIVRALVDSGADVGRRTSYGWSALTTATMLGKTPMVAGKILRTHLPDGSLTEDRQWRRKGLHKAACWFEHDRAWPPKECYYFVVNEDPDDEASSLIAFPVVHFRTGSAEPHGNPVLHLGGGGPGSAMDFETDPVFILSEYEALVSGSGRDFYVIDPRGVGMSYPGLHCRDALDPVRQGLSKKLDASDDGMLWNEAYVACKTRLDSEGRNLSHYNSAAVAMDVEALRRALGVPQWVLWGSSYGARYALTIARDFPASVEAMLLNGTAFPGLQDTETRAGDMERAIERAFVRCGRIGVCDPQSLRKRFWGPGAQLRRASARIDRPRDSLVPLRRTP